MRPGTLLPLLLAALLLAHAPRAAAQTASPYGAPPAAWARYTYPGEELSFEVPEMPLLTHTVRSFGRFPNHKTEKMRVYSLYSGGVIYFVAAYDKPQQSESLDDFAAYLRGAWELAPKGAAALGGFEGKAYGVEGLKFRGATTELYGEGRAFRTKRHAYFTLALTRESGRPEVGRFLDSLTLGAEPSGERIVAEPKPVPYIAPTQQGSTAAAGEGGGGKLVPLSEAGAQGASDAPLSPREVTQRPVIVYKPEPGYTEEGRRNNTRGTVALRVILSATGEVRNITVSKGLPNGLTEKAVAAARRMLFFPALKDGQPVSQFVLLEYNFNIY